MLFVQFPDNRDKGWPQYYDEERGENTEYERKNDLDGRLHHLFLRTMTAFDANHVGLNMERIRDAATHLVYMDDRGDERPHVLDAYATAQVNKGIHAWLAESNLIQSLGELAGGGAGLFFQPVAGGGIEAQARLFPKSKQVEANRES